MKHRLIAGGGDLEESAATVCATALRRAVKDVASLDYASFRVLAVRFAPLKTVQNAFGP
jgi:hypothetical protein